MKSLSTASDWFDELVTSCSSLQKLVRRVAYFFRWLGRASRFKVNMELKGPITTAEYQDAFHFLIFFDQKLHYDVKKNERLVTKKITVKLSAINKTIDYLVLSGRVKNFPIGFTVE